MMMKPTRSKSIIMLEVVLKPWKRISEATIVTVMKLTKYMGFML